MEFFPIFFLASQSAHQEHLVMVANNYVNAWIMLRVTMSQVLATAVQASKESDVTKVQWNSACKISLFFSLSPSNDVLALKK